MASEWNGWLPNGGLLEGKVALIAGAGRDIGTATARILSAAGATVAVLDREADRVEEAVAEVTSSGGTALPLVADLTKREECTDAVERTVADLGGLDILVNNAGGVFAHAKMRPLDEWTDESWDTVVHLNMRYVFWMCRAAIPAMKARGGGSIVNVASIAALFASPNQSAYGAAKAGMIQLTKTLAQEYGPAGIRANVVTPGPTVTRFLEEVMSEPARKALSDPTPLRKLGRPEDTARAVLFFASPMSEHTTGQMLTVEGGISIAFPYPSLASDPT